MKMASNQKNKTTFTFTTFWAYGVKVVLFFWFEAVFMPKTGSRKNLKLEIKRHWNFFLLELCCPVWQMAFYVMQIYKFDKVVTFWQRKFVVQLSWQIFVLKMSWQMRTLLCWMHLKLPWWQCGKVSPETGSKKYWKSWLFEKIKKCEFLQCTCRTDATLNCSAWLSGAISCWL